ncbi:MAG TPA: acetylornithine transaminase [Egibacteraceae bacterium]|nr:acetylornithine transaminase [Egibacteraceae bacterium]
MMSGSSSPQGGSRPMMSGSSSPWMEREAAAILPTYGRRPVVFVRGSGMRLYDDDGREYLDALSGLSVTSLGHAHPAVTEAVARQAATLVHTSNLFFTTPQIELAERLADTLGWADGRSFFSNSGAEANEAAIKLARRHGKRRHPDKVNVVALHGGFHGRLLGPLLLTGNPAKHEPFQPLGGWVTHVPHDDAAALTRAVDERTCAVWLEVVQGEGGVRSVPEDVLQAARSACDAHDALLVIDEVQTGIGRLGSWYGWQQTAVEPDVVCLAKALANGLPIGATVARGAAAEAFAAGDHASTFGGGPVVTAAALAVLDTVARDGLVEHAAAMGTALRRRLEELVTAQPLATGIRGRGLLQGLELAGDVAATVVGAALDAGLVVNDVAPDVLRLAPPLIMGDAELDQLAERLDAALSTAARAL